MVPALPSRFSIDGPAGGLNARVRPYQLAHVRHRRIQEAFEPRSLAGLPAHLGPVDYAQRLRMVRQQRAGMESLAGLRRGLGESDTTKQIAMSATQIAGGVAATVVGTIGTTAATAATATTAATAATMATWAAVAVPLIGAAVVGVTLWLTSMFKRNAQKEAATDIVDQIEVQLKSNLDGYLSGPRTAQSQLQALANFDAGWQAVLENCGNPQLGSAGERCISERQEGGVAPWCTKPGGKGCDWFTRYRDPIANDIPVQSQNILDGSGMAVDTINEVFGGSVQVGGMEIPNTLLLGAGVIILALSMGGDSKSGGRK